MAPLIRHLGHDARDLTNAYLATTLCGMSLLIAACVCLFFFH
jgi:hypothetical protein